MKVIIFDMDGTLLDSKEDITISINHVRQVNHDLHPLSESFIVDAINKDVRNLAQLFYQTEKYEHRDRELFEQHYALQCTQNTYLYDEVYDTLEKLMGCGIKLSVATNAPSQFAHAMLGHLGVDGYFDYIVGADDVKSSKPSPEMLDTILEKYAFDKKNHQAWMVGDNYKDMQSASNAGIDSIFATWGFSPSSKHHTTIHKPSELLEIIL